MKEDQENIESGANEPVQDAGSVLTTGGGVIESAIVPLGKGKWSPDKLEKVSLSALKPYAKNARKHSKKQIAKIKASIDTVGYINPIIIDENNTILAGHGRWEAAKSAGLETVPVVRAPHLTEKQKQAYVIADNHLAEESSWDSGLLAEGVKSLLGPDELIEMTGFETVDIDKLLDGKAAKDFAKQEAVPVVDEKQPPVSKLGDLWTLGQHKLLCADARLPTSYEQLLGEERAQMVLTDPPYNVSMGTVVNSGNIQHPEFPMASGEMSDGEFTAFLKEIFQRLTQFSVDGSIHFIFMDWRHAYVLLTAANGVYKDQKNRCVWNKDNAGLGSFYRSKHEDIYVFKNGSAPEINNFGMGAKRYRTNIWDYPGVNIRRPGGVSDLQLHPTAKPVAMFVDAMLDCSKPKGIVLDPFSGSGTTIIAAERSKRVARALELDARYVDLAVLRWEHATGQKAMHLETGLCFADVAKKRAVPIPHFSFGPKKLTIGAK